MFKETWNTNYTPDIRSMWLYSRHTKYVVIPRTYEVCGYTPDIRSMWLYPRHTKYVVIPPTYEVCGYTPDIRSMWGYIVFAFPFVCSFVRSYVCSFVCLFVRSYIHSSFRHRVKVFALKFIRPHILTTLWWISFIFGMMVDIGLKFLSVPSPPRGWPWGQGHGLRIFIKQSKFFCV